MRITKHWHSCLLVEEGNTRILIDPGEYSFLPGRAKPEDFTGLTAILITHEHGDHADPQAIKKILHKNPVPVYGNGEVKKKLAPFGIETILLEDHVIKIGGMQVEAISAEHGPLIEDTPPNNAYFIDNAFLVPGDSYDRPLKKIKARALALPILSPWAGMTGAFELMRCVEPKFVIPIHDGFVLDDAREGQQEMWAEVCTKEGVDFRSLKTPKEFLEV